MLPNSTERAITIAGTPQSIIECVKQICVVMLEVTLPPLPNAWKCAATHFSFSFFYFLPLRQSPPKGVTIPYRPKPSGSPVIFAGGQVNISPAPSAGASAR